MKSWDNVKRDELLKMKAKGNSWKDITSTLQTHSEYDCRTYWMIHYWPTPNDLELNDSRISEVALSNLTYSKYLQDTTAGQAQQAQEDSRRVYGQVDAVDEEAVPRDSQRVHFTPAQSISAQVMQAQPMQAQPTLAPPTQAQSMQTQPTHPQFMQAQPTQAQTPAQLRESPSDETLGQSLVEYLRRDRWKLGSTADTDHVRGKGGSSFSRLQNGECMLFLYDMGTADCGFHYDNILLIAWFSCLCCQSLVCKSCLLTAGVACSLLLVRSNIGVLNGMECPNRQSVQRCSHTDSTYKKIKQCREFLSEAG